MDKFTYILYTDMDTAVFEWDARKDAENRAKHGVSFEFAQYAFCDSKRIIVADLAHSWIEPRFFCFGRIGDGILTVRFTLRMNGIRIIGAGYWRKGKSIYERENQIH